MNGQQFVRALLTVLAACCLGALLLAAGPATQPAGGPAQAPGAANKPADKPTGKHGGGRHSVSVKLLDKAPAVDPDAVQQAIKDRIDYIYSQQNADGTWEKADANKDDQAYGGMTALAVYSLLAAHEEETDPRLVKALEFLKTTKLNGTYAVGLRCNVWNLLKKQTDEIRGMIKIDAEWLLIAYHKAGLGIGKFDYRQKDTNFDHSVSQYGVLGLWACAQQRLEVPDDFWKAADTGWKEWQNPDGGWCYCRQGDVNAPWGPGLCGPSTGNLTAAGIATLFITEDELYADRGINCAGNQRDDTMKDIEKGLAWMADPQNLDQINEGYGYYGVERIGVASGYKYFGNQDWFQFFAAKVLKTKAGDNGRWGEVPEACFQLLFLVRGRAPVLFNKLDYSLAAAAGAAVPANWNERPRDCANLCRYAFKVSEHDFNWQIVNLNVPVEELHDSPILYIAGNQDLTLSPQDEDKLREFVEQGGLILGNADCASATFSDGFQKLGSRLFPNYEFRKLPLTHFIYNNVFKAKAWKGPPPEVLGMTNGTRELMLLIDKADCSRFWQTGSIAGKEEFHQIMVNIESYAVQTIGDPPSGHLRPKGVTYIVDANPAIKATGELKVARLELGDNWNPEPGGWQRLANVMHNHDKIDLSVDEVKVGEGKLDPAVYKVAHLTGTTKVEFSPAQIDELKQYIAGGGTLIVDAAGDNPLGTAGGFKDAVEAALPQLVPDSRLRPLASDFPALMDGDKPLALELSPYQHKLSGYGGHIRIKGIQVAGRTAIFYSPEDISTGLVGMYIEGIGGYQPDAATTLMERLLLYANNPTDAATQGAAANSTTRPAGGVSTTKPVAAAKN